MIIQCGKCETRFRFDESLMEGDGVWVRCSRCQHVFFQERPGDDFRAESEIPSVRISDARRAPDDRFPPAAHGPAPAAKSAEIRPRPGSGGPTERTVEFEKESSFEGLEVDLGREPVGGPEARVEKEEEAAEVEAEAKGGSGQRRWGLMLLKLVALLLFIAFVGGAVYLYLFPEARTQVLNWASPWLRGVPYLERLAGTETKGSGSAVAPVRIKDLRQRSVNNLLTGNLRVIEGVAVNQTSHPLARIRVRLVVADAYDVVLAEKIVSCGNLLTDVELGAMAEVEIQRELSIAQGSDVSNERIEPNGEIPFMIVFSQEQAGAVKTTVLPAGADKVP